MPQFMQIQFLPLRLEALKGRWALTFPANSYVSSQRLSHNCWTWCCFCGRQSDGEQFQNSIRSIFTFFFFFNKAVFLSKYHLGGLVSVVYVTMHHTHTYDCPSFKTSCFLQTHSVCQTETTVSTGSSRLCVTPSLHRAVNSQVAAALPRLNSQVPSRAVCHRNGSIWKQAKGLTLDSTRSM